MSRKIKLAVNGAGGRMGKRVIALASAAPDMVLTAAFERKGHPGLGNGDPVLRTLDDPRAKSVQMDVLIDFSLPEGCIQAVELCLSTSTPAVLCTTGLSDKQKTVLKKASKKIALIHAPNTSLGMNLLIYLVESAARRMPHADIELTEIHHKLKQDAPSGSALALAGAVQAGRGKSGKLVHGRAGKTGARPADQIGVFGLRGGDVTGDHTVYLFGDGERLELTHRAHSRDTFAAGALTAARWLVNRNPGMYSMKDVLEL